MSELKLASAGNDIRLWDIDSGYTLVKQFSPHNQSTSGLAWSHDNKSLASAAIGDKVVLTYTETFEYASNVAVGENRSCVAFNANSRYVIAGGTDGNINLCDLKTNRLKKSYKDHKGLVTSVSFNWNDTDIASSSETGDIILYNVMSGQSSSPLRTPKVQAVRQIQYSHFKKSLLGSVSDDGALNLWNTNRRQLVHSFNDLHKAPATALAFSPFNQKLIMSVGLDKRIICYDADVKQPIKSMVAESPLTSVDVMADGATVAVGSTRGKIYIYDLRQASNPVHILQGHKSSVQSLKFQYNIRKVESTIRSGKSGSSSSLKSQPTTNTNANKTAAAKTKTEEDINANQTDLTAALDRVNCNQALDPAVNHVSRDLGNPEVFSPIRDRLSNPLWTPKTARSMAQKVTPSPGQGAVNGTGLDEHPSGIPNGKISLGMSNNSAEEFHDAVFSPINGDGSANSTRGLQADGSTPAQLSAPIPRHSVPEITQLSAPTPRHSVPEITQPSFNDTYLNETTEPQVYSGSRRASGDRQPSVERRSSLERRSTAPGVEAPAEVRGSPRGNASSVAVRFQQSPHQVREVSLNGPSVGAIGGAEAGEPSVAEGATGTVAPFHLAMMRNLVQEAMEELRDEMRKDMLNLYVEMLKQFQTQQVEFHTLLQKYSVNDELMAEIERLREENKRLKQNF